MTTKIKIGDTVYFTGYRSGEGDTPVVGTAGVVTEVRGDDILVDMSDWPDVQPEMFYIDEVSKGKVGA